MAVIGGTLYDINGNWIWGFIVSIGINSVDDAETKALLYGLKRGCEQRIKKIIVESNFKSVIKWVNENTEEGHHFFSEIMECKQLIHMPWTCSVKYISRKSNEVANCLVKMSHHHLGNQKVIFDNPPLEVVDLVVQLEARTSVLF